MPQRYIQPHPKQKYTEFPWLELSLNSFNGSGYADRRTEDTFMESYLAYQQWKNRPYGMAMADKYWFSGKVVANELIKHPQGPRMPRYSAAKQFAKFYPPALEYLC